MGYNKLELRNKSFALLRRLERKKSASQICNEIIKDKKDKKDLFKDEFEKEKEHLTRLNLYDRRKGRSFI